MATVALSLQFHATNPPPFATTLLVLSPFCREAAKIFRKYKSLTKSENLGILATLAINPPLVSAHPATRGGVIATNTIDQSVCIILLEEKYTKAHKTREKKWKNFFFWKIWIFRKFFQKMFGWNFRKYKSLRFWTKFWTFSTLAINPPCFGASGNNGGVYGYEYHW